jgi:EmrB/QacA subfamily drug resistance transporter
VTAEVGVVDHYGLYRGITRITLQEDTDMPELTRRRRRLVLAICCMSLLIVGLDNSIVNVALPAIQRDLHASVSGLQWTISGYALVLATLLMLSGSTGDRIGRRRTFQAGLVVFTVGSMLCSLAPGLGWLVAFRMVQAVGGSMLNPVAMSIITNVFTEPRERAQAIGIWGGVVGISMALGPVVGGALVDSVGWRSIFWINIPVGVAALALTAAFVPESRAATPRRLDPIGQTLVLGFLATLTYAIIEGPHRGWSSPLIVGCFVAAAVQVSTLVRYESRRYEPLIDLRFFRSVPFSSATVIAICGFAAMFGFMFLTTLYLQNVRGFTPLEAGLSTLPIAVPAVIISPLSGRVVGVYGGRWPLAAAGGGMTTAALMLTRLDNNTAIGYLIATYLVFGFGFGWLNPPITQAAVSGMPREQAGVAAAIASTSRQVGQSLGVAVIGTAVSSAIGGSFATSFASASHVGWWIITGCGLTVLVVGIASTSAWARGTADRVRAGTVPAQRGPADSAPVSEGGGAFRSAGSARGSTPR